MKLKIDFENKTLAFEGEYSVVEFLELLEEMPSLEAFSIVPLVETKIVEKTIIREEPFQQPYVQNKPHFDLHVPHIPNNYEILCDGFGTTNITDGSDILWINTEVDCFSGQPVNQYSKTFGQAASDH